MGKEKYTPNRAHFFVRKKYTTFTTERIVALRSVKKKNSRRATISQLLSNLIWIFEARMAMSEITTNES
jgi:hypothetical protein